MRSGKDEAFITATTRSTAYGYRRRRSPRWRGLDVPYLGAVMLEAAGLPLSDVYPRAPAADDVVQGRYRDCAERSEMLKFHRRMIDLPDGLALKVCSIQIEFSTTRAVSIPPPRGQGYRMWPRRSKR